MLSDWRQLVVLAEKVELEEMKASICHKKKELDEPFVASLKPPHEPDGVSRTGSSRRKRKMDFLQATKPGRNGRRRKGRALSRAQSRQMRRNEPSTGQTPLTIPRWTSAGELSYFETDLPDRHARRPSGHRD